MIAKIEQLEKQIEELKTELAVKDDLINKWKANAEMWAEKYKKLMFEVNWEELKKDVDN